MRVRILLLASAFLSATALPAQAGLYNLISNDFSSNPFASPNNLPAFLAGTTDWFGAQHGRTGLTGTPPAPTGAFTMAWRNSPGADGANGYIGYSPTTRVGVTLLTRLPSVTDFSALRTLSVEARNAGSSEGVGQPAEPLFAAIHTGGSGGSWYVSTTGISGNSTTADWIKVAFDLQSLSYRLRTNDNDLPNTATGSPLSLPGTLQVDWVGFYVGYSGQNNPNRGDVLRFDNFQLTAQAVPEPATAVLLGAGLLGLGMLRRRG